MKEGEVLRWCLREDNDEDLEIIIVPGYKTKIILVIFYGIFENIP